MTTLSSYSFNSTETLLLESSTFAALLEAQTADYVFAATITAWAWDILMYMDEEYLLLFKTKLSVPQIGYIISRVSTFLYLMLCFLGQGTWIRMDDCGRLIFALGFIGAIPIIANSFLMLVRVRAVFFNSARIRTFFSFLWAVNVVGSLTLPFAMKSGRGPGGTCVLIKLEPYLAFVAAIFAAIDTLTFLAITYRVLSSLHAADGWSSRINAFIHGDDVGKLHRLLLKTGQTYYLATVWIKITTAIILALPLSPLVRSSVGVPDIALINIMTCRVFRRLKLESITDSQGSTDIQIPTSINFAPPRSISRSWNNPSGIRSGQSEQPPISVASRISRETV